MAKADKAVPSEKEEGKVQVKVDRSVYVAGKTAEGKKSLHNDDPVAQALNGVALGQLYKTAAKFLEQTAKSLQEKYEHLNVGMQRMNLGNRIRGKIAQMDKVEGAKEGSGLKAFQAAL